ncbi:hypothetical protein CEXT_503441 [Caerostris extrusa]|uniref:Uncharacterized protein n=1 Tax=Caerostris extrusa TaxID=172846 RepID=A0AAV4V160_CAEEX|nr:hypothetical protein CEXT_503441 [Caerostris extrusa]
MVQKKQKNGVDRPLPEEEIPMQHATSSALLSLVKAIDRRDTIFNFIYKFPMRDIMYPKNLAETCCRSVVANEILTLAIKIFFALAIEFLMTLDRILAVTCYQNLADACY